MGDLISKSTLIEELKQEPSYFESGDIRYGIEIAINVVTKQSPIEPVSGKWIHDINNMYGCSVCMNRENMSPKKMKSFCPDCGAYMKGE